MFHCQGFERLIREWPSDLYSIQAIVTAVTSKLERDPNNRVLLHCLADLWVYFYIDNNILSENYANLFFCFWKLSKNIINWHWIQLWPNTSIYGVNLIRKNQRIAAFGAFGARCRQNSWKIWPIKCLSCLSCRTNLEVANSGFSESNWPIFMSDCLCSQDNTF